MRDVFGEHVRRHMASVISRQTFFERDLCPTDLFASLPLSCRQGCRLSNHRLISLSRTYPLFVPNASSSMIQFPHHLLLRSGESAGLARSLCLADDLTLKKFQPTPKATDSDRRLG